jgi:SWI/SNF-related matrix-associated actin-dependent regulator of chromatin subfamily A3
MPLAILVFTPKGNVPHVSATLMQAGLMLDHPTSIFDLTPILHRVKYHNPHSPPPGGFRAITNGRNNPLPLKPFSKSSAPQVPPKSVEIQRSQVEDVFQKLRSEGDLKETSPGTCLLMYVVRQTKCTSDILSFSKGPNICTDLYPHQKKAVTFLLEREQEIVCPAGKAGSLWNPHGHAWQNVITQEVVFTKPRECKGALLADDMGLGKSLVSRFSSFCGGEVIGD